jgi:hypothetical protein
MRTNLTHEIRALLRASPDGLDVYALVGYLEREMSSIHKQLTRMPDAYIDRWTQTSGSPRAVWCVVVPPENCPKPEPKRRRIRDGRQS